MMRKCLILIKIIVVCSSDFLRIVSWSLSDSNATNVHEGECVGVVAFEKMYSYAGHVEAYLVYGQTTKSE